MASRTLAMSQQASIIDFERFPENIRFQIYDQLLHAGIVRQSPAQGVVERYKVTAPGAEMDRVANRCKFNFETAILRVCRLVHREASDTLYCRNHFILVSTNMTRLSEPMLDHGVIAIAYGKELLKTFKKHVLSVHMILPGSVKQSNAASFILPAQEIPRFVRLLQIFRTQHFTGTFKLQFHGQTDCHNPPDPVVQRLVLDPFRSLDLDDHSLLFDGAIDIAYQQELRASIVPRIGWIRGLAWKTYDILVSLAEEGHEAFRLGKYDCAGNRYDDALTACVLAFGEHPILGAFCDTEWQGHCSTLYLNTRANYALAAVRQGDWPRVLAATSALATTTDLTQSAMYRCRAIALAVQKDDKQSLDCLSKAAAMDPTNESLQSLVHGTTEESTQALAVISSAAYHGELTYLVDTSPLQLEVNISIAEERCVLLFFRYSGDLLFDRIRGSNQMDRNKVARVIKEIINGMKEKARTNSNLCAWIGEEANVHYFPD